MEIEAIFVDENTWEGLHSVWYDGADMCEFDRLIDLWLDPEYVSEYCMKNLIFINNVHFRGLSLDDVIKKILEESVSLYDYLEDFTYESFKSHKPKLDSIFRPFDKKISLSVSLDRSKFSFYKKHPDPILRMYAVKLDTNSFIISGGVIKLVKKLQDHPDTAKEEMKVNRVITYLKKEKDIETQQDLIYYYE